MEQLTNIKLPAASLKEKSWTVFIYANGNNDLEPEMVQAVYRLGEIAASSVINIVVQLARAKIELVRLVRPGIPLGSETWHGVRRYVLVGNKLHLLASFKNMNMADPQSLYRFIKWGMQSFPAERYMLILGGHGYQFVGAMTDYTQKVPYIMGIPEMVGAINAAGRESGEKIDILVLDICYFNFMEVIYELGQEENHVVRYMLTYVYDGPLEGMSYAGIIELLTEIYAQDTNSIIREVIDYLPHDLVGFAIQHRQLEQIKHQIHQFALDCCNSKMKKDMPLFHFSGELTGCAYSICANLFSLILYFKRRQSAKPLVSFANVTTSDPGLIARYHRLGFARHNQWTYLLSGQTFDVDAAREGGRGLRPIKLTFDEVYAFISITNPELTENEKIKLVRNLFFQRKWK